MIRVHLNSIYVKQDFIDGDFNYNDIKKQANNLRTNINNSELYFHPVSGSYLNLLKRAREVITTNKDLYQQSDVVKQLFTNLFVFPDNKAFMDVVERYQISVPYSISILNCIEKIKQKGIPVISFPFDKINDIKKHYNINSSEFILNKLSEIFYYDAQLVESYKTKTKSHN